MKRLAHGIVLLAVCSGVARAQSGGLYIGLQAGGGTNHSQTTVVDGSAAFASGTVLNATNGTGGLGGAYIGYDYRSGHLVLGVDADYSASHITGSETTTGSSGYTVMSTTNLKSLTTVTARLGRAMSGWLWYVKAGLASGSVDGSSTTTNPGGSTVANGASSTTRSGWVAGLGVQERISARWSVKYEYNYIDFGTANYTLTSTAVPSGTVTSLARSATSSANTLKVGLAFRP